MSRKTAPAARTVPAVRRVAATADESPHTAAPDRWLTIGLAAALIAAVFITFSPALSAGFVWDDQVNITENTHFRSFSAENLHWMFTAFRAGHYHPLTWLSFALDHAIAGLDPHIYHFTNILIHAINAVLFFLLARLLLSMSGLSGMCHRSPGSAGDLCDRRVTLLAALAAALWALHPLRTESVAWVTARRDVLSTMFMLAGALAYLRAFSAIDAPSSSSEQHGPRIRWAPYTLCILFTLLACLSKGAAMGFFAMLFALDLWPLRRVRPDARSLLRLIVEKTPFIIIGLATAAVAAASARQGYATKTLAEWGITERIVQAAYGLWFYTKATFAPAGLSPLYQLPIDLHPFEPRYLVAYAFDLGVLAAVILSLRRKSALAAAAAIYIISLAPVLGPLQSGDQFVADRYSYIATMPLFILAAAAAVKLLGWHWQLAASGDAPERKSRLKPRAPMPILISVISAILLFTLASLTFAQSSYWRNSETLWSYAASLTPTNPSSIVLDNLALVAADQGRTDESARLYQLATQINPRDGRAWFAHANNLRDAGNLEQAEIAYLQAAQHMPQAYMAHLNLGLLYQKHGHADRAMDQFRLAVADIERGGPRILSGRPYMTLGIALLAQDKKDEAAANFRRALTFTDTHDSAEQELKAIGR